jgi:hypothetical protein
MEVVRGERAAAEHAGSIVLTKLDQVRTGEHLHARTRDQRVESRRGDRPRRQRERRIGARYLSCVERGAEAIGGRRLPCRHGGRPLAKHLAPGASGLSWAFAADVGDGSGGVGATVRVGGCDGGHTGGVAPHA